MNKKEKITIDQWLEQRSIEDANGAIFKTNQESILRFVGKQKSVVYEVGRQLGKWHDEPTAAMDEWDHMYYMWCDMLELEPVEKP